MKYTIYKNEVGQLMAMEGHTEFDGVVAKVYDLESNCDVVHFQPETTLEHYWFKQIDEMREALSELVDLVEDARDGSYTIDSFTLQPARAVLQKLEGGK